MKLICIDGITRDFSNSESLFPFNGYSEVKCKGCGTKFGVHSISAIKEILRKHICGVEE